MDYTRLGRSGLKVSRIGLGMMSYGTGQPWYLSLEEAEPLVARAVEGGVTLFDTADMYSGGESERITGRLLSRLFRDRDDYVLATKLYYPTGSGPNDRGLSRKHVLDAVDASLRRLGTDHIDLYQVHRWDPGTPVEETMTALDDVVRAGKVRYLGASLMYGWQLAKACFAGPTPFASMQTRYNLLYREEEREVIPFCADQGLGVLAYSPLARGRLAGRRDTPRSRSESPASAGPGDEGVLSALDAVASSRGVPPGRVAMAWLLAQPAVTAPLVGVTRAAHLDDALAALDLHLTDEELSSLATPYRARAPYGYD